MSQKEQVLGGFGVIFSLSVMIAGIYSLSAPFTFLGMVFFFAFIGQIKEDREENE